jgi:hypothetical protein
MIRTVWLALFCLISLGAMAALRIAMTPSVSADASPARMTWAANLKQDTLAKTDKLQVSYIEEAPEKKLVTTIAVVPPKMTSKPAEEITKIISRHWHEGHAKQIGPSPRHRRDVSRAKHRSERAPAVLSSWG